MTLTSRLNRSFRTLPSKPLRAAALLAAVLLPGAPAWADGDVIAPGTGMRELADDNQNRWGLGLGLGVQRQPYTGIDSKTRVLPLISFENRYVRVLGLGADLKLPSAGPVSFALRVRYSGEGYSESDAPILSGMDKRKGAVLAGGAAMWRTPDYGLLSAEVLGDASGASGGLQAKLGYDVPFRLGAFMVTPHVSATYLDRKTVDYYYGVKASEARVGRAQYDAGSTTNAEVGIRTGFALAPNQQLVLDLGITKLGSAITDSPLVDRSTQSSVRLGYIYRF